ncbi:hypothetical protein K461DRAFT_296742 [Myriangium duriaei CBS 260.36]|uniref:Uncharacterized protein n=1 Tax=Myriangium duriaei CBS 260.36 TaxID=1168546 RepID=A0A9P4MDJ6_9PEZI|nr:hypothetical protein K461DRAFT_296742 [Myriangium duriaei CBS 260.36]
MTQINPTLLAFLVCIGGGFLVLMFAGFHYYLGPKGRPDPYSRTPEQDAYMGEVRQRGFESLMPPRRSQRGYASYADMASPQTEASNRV